MSYRRRLPAYLGVPNQILDLHASCYLPGVAPFNVSTWRSIPPLGAGVAVTQPTPANQPTHVVVAGVGPAVLFDQVNDVMGPLALTVSSAVDWTVSCCMTTPSSLSAGNVHYLYGGSAASSNGAFLQGTAVVQWGWQTDATLVLSGEAMPAGTHVATVRKTGATYDLYRDGVFKATGLVVARSLSGFMLNTNSGGTLPGGLAGGLHRIVAWASALSAGDITLSTQRLLQEWN